MDGLSLCNNIIIWFQNKNIFQPLWCYLVQRWILSKQAGVEAKKLSKNAMENHKTACVQKASTFSILGIDNTISIITKHYNYTLSPLDKASLWNQAKPRKFTSETRKGEQQKS